MLTQMAFLVSCGQCLKLDCPVSSPERTPGTMDRVMVLAITVWKLVNRYGRLSVATPGSDDDLLPVVMMAYRSGVHESTGFSPYRRIFGKKYTFPMDVGLPWRNHDMPDPIKNMYALWVRDALKVAYDEVRQLGDKNNFMISGLSNVCLW